MKCPKCHYVSHDYLDACRKCGIDLVMFKQDMGLVVLQPGVLDLSLVLSGVGADDLFASIDEEVPMYASDEDFDISLDDDAEHSAVRQAPPGGLRPGRPESEIDLADRDRLTLELDAADLPDAVPASRRAAQVSSNAPVAPARPPPAEPGTIPLPDHVTLDMEAESISMDFPPGLLGEIVSAGPRRPTMHQHRQKCRTPQSLCNSIEVTVTSGTSHPRPRRRLRVATQQGLKALRSLNLWWSIPPCRPCNYPIRQWMTMTWRMWPSRL